MMKHRVRITYNAPVILTFSLICLLATVLGIATKGLTTDLLFMTYHSPLKNPLTIVRFFTHVFGHVDWEHFAGNITLFLLIGPMLEEKYGGKLLMLVILVTAVITGLFNYVVFPNVALCGASGVVFAFILMSSFTSFREGQIPITFLVVAVVFLGKEIYDGIIVSDSISNMSHVLGGVVGAGFGFLLQRHARFEKHDDHRHPFENHHGDHHEAHHDDLH